MKKGMKKFISILALVLATVFCFSFAGCGGDYKTLEVEVQIYDYSTNQVKEDTTIEIKLYRNLAPDTVDAIVSYAEEGYYNNSVFYMDSDYSKQIMVGDVKLDGQALKQNGIKPQLEGEFEHGGTQGSNLVNTKGSVGLWRSWNAIDDNDVEYKANNGMDSGRATMFMPLESNSNFNGYFCVFGTIDLEKYGKTFSAIEESLKSTTNTDNYVIYYTGEYDATAVNSNYGLTQHIVTAEAYNDLTSEEKEDIFQAEEGQYVSFNKRTIKVAKDPTGGVAGTIIKNVKVK